MFYVRSEIGHYWTDWILGQHVLLPCQACVSCHLKGFSTNFQDTLLIYCNEWHLLYLTLAFCSVDFPIRKHMSIFRIKLHSSKGLKVPANTKQTGHHVNIYLTLAWLELSSICSRGQLISGTLAHHLHKVCSMISCKPALPVFHCPNRLTLPGPFVSMSCTWP